MENWFIKKVDQVTECNNGFIPWIFLISKETWLSEPDADWDADLKERFTNMKQCMAWYHPWSNIIFFREDCFTYRILFHELGHWFIHKMFHGFKFHTPAQAWWDRKCLFVFHMANMAIKVGIARLTDFAGVAQLEEHRTCNAAVGGSIPPTGSKDGGQDV